MPPHAALVDKALALGAVQAKLVPTDALVLEQRVTFKCRFGCPEYGRGHACPPRVPSVAEFREALGEYNYALVVAFPTTAVLEGEESRSLQRVRHDGAAAAAAKAKVEAFYAEFNRSKLTAFDSLLELEREAFNAGDPLALALRPGRCNLCETCDVDKPCKQPTRLRFSPEAVGINLSATCQRANMDLVFPFDKNPSHIGMVLLG
jgi:predicted metal-binding protein